MPNLKISLCEPNRLDHLTTFNELLIALGCDDDHPVRFDVVEKTLTASTSVESLVIPTTDEEV